MTKTEIDLMIELQDVFAEAMGPLQEGDRVIKLRTKKIEIVKSVFASIYPFDTNKSVGCKYDEFARLPLPIDPDDPERIAKGEKPRGLWEMVDWGKWNLFQNFDGTVFLRDENNRELFVGCRTMNVSVTEALLLAIKAQKEGK